MKLFALGPIVSAGSVYIGLAGEVAKFTEMAIITLRILSSVGDAWRPPGHPRRFSPVQVVSLLDTAVCSYSKQNSLCVMEFVSLGRYGRLQRVKKWCCSLFIFSLFWIFDSYYSYLQCLFTLHSLTTILSLFWFVITQPPTQKFQPLMDFLKIF